MERVTIIPGPKDHKQKQYKEPDLLLFADLIKPETYIKGVRWMVSGVRKSAVAVLNQIGFTRRRLKATKNS